MALPIGFLGKLKTLFPVLVVGGAVVITIKLLTQETPSNSQIIQVKAEEDIAETKHEEILEEEPEVPPEPEQEPVAEVESQEDSSAKETEEEGVAEDSSQSESDKEKAEEKQQSEQEKQESAPRKLIQNELGEILGKLIN